VGSSTYQSVYAPGRRVRFAGSVGRERKRPSALPTSRERTAKQDALGPSRPRDDQRPESQSTSPWYFGDEAFESDVFSFMPQHVPTCVYCMNGPFVPAFSWASRYCL